MRIPKDIDRKYVETSISAIVLLIGFISIYASTITKMVEIWKNNDNYSHGFLIPLITFYLIWNKREKLKTMPAQPANIGFLLLALSLLFFVITNIAAELFTMRISMIFVIWSLVVLLLGWKFAKELFVSIGYLIFMIPFPALIWNKIAFTLKLFATKMAVGAIGAAGIVVYAEGNIIYLANTTLEVVDACSGLRSLISLMSLSAAFALISNLNYMKRIILFLSAVPIAIVLNVIRLFSTAVLAHFYGAEVADGFLHEISGIIIFLMALSILALIYWLMNRPMESSQVDD